MTEFLSLCDVLFNVVSLAGYFCDVVFDVVLSYALFERGHFLYMAFVIALVMVSLIISQVIKKKCFQKSNVQKEKKCPQLKLNICFQILSLRWYMQKIEMRSRDLVPVNGTIGDSNDQKKSMDITANSSSTESSDQTLQSKIERHCVIALHCCQLGVLWRYAKLFVPVNLRHVKHEVRDLCMLRLVHAFCEAAPMLLLQLYILVTIQKEEANLLKPEIPLQSLGAGHVAPVIVQQPTDSQQHQLQTFKDLNIVSCTLSLFSVCWALASFSKNVRIQNVHRLVLTWLGVIFQFLWRLGTVISRVASLTVYASIYKQWVILVIALHWISMFLWLISPKNVFHGERITRLRKITLAGLIAFVYVFAYINLQEVNHRQKMFIFYFVMFLENSLLVFLWLIGIWIDKPENWYMTPIWIFASFLAGLLFMFLYYRCVENLHFFSSV